MIKLLMFGFLLFANKISAQVKITARGGINFANMYKPGGFILRANAGLQLEFPLGDEWFIYSGIHYSGKGGRFGHRYLSTRRDSLTIRLNYIEVPVYFARPFGDEETGQYWIAGGGPYIGYGFLGSYKWNGGSPPPTYNLHKKEKEWYRRLEWGFGFFLQRSINERWSLRTDVSGSLFHITYPPHGRKRNAVGGLSVQYHFN